MADFTRVIPWLQEYPTWLQVAASAWVATGVVLLILFVFVPRKSPIAALEPVTPPVPRAETSSSQGASKTGSRNITQETKGDNSPAVAGVEGNVTITVEQGKSGK